MKIHLNKNRGNCGAIWFWILVVIVVVVVAFIIVSIYTIAKKLNTEPPRWPQPNEVFMYDAEATNAALAEVGYPEGATATAYRHFVFPSGYGVTWLTTNNGATWEEPVTNTMEQFADWTIPQPYDQSVPSRFWKRMYIQTNNLPE